MPRIASRLPAVALVALLGAGCSRPKPPSAFARDTSVTQVFDALAKRAGVAPEGFSLATGHDGTTGKSNWKGNVRYCARPEQIDELMRAAHAEFVNKLRESGAEPGGDAPPPAPAAVKGWKITYTAGAQEGTFGVARNDGEEGSCREKGRLAYQVDFVLDEAPKAAP